MSCHGVQYNRPSRFIHKVTTFQNIFELGNGVVHELRVIWTRHVNVHDRISKI